MVHSGGYMGRQNAYSEGWVRMKSAILDVTGRIAERGAKSRAAYLNQLNTMAARKRGSKHMGCANVAHAFAALPGPEKIRVVEEHCPQ